MNKKLMLCMTACALFLSTCLFVQQAFEKGNNLLTFGYGFSAYGGLLFTEYHNTYTDINRSVIGPIYGKYEHAVTDHFGIGVNFSSVNIRYTYIDVDFP